MGMWGKWKIVMIKMNDLKKVRNPLIGHNLGNTLVNLSILTLRCVNTLIQSFDDLEASRTLLSNEHFSQSVFMSSQSVEKGFKEPFVLLQIFF